MGGGSINGYAKTYSVPSHSYIEILMDEAVVLGQHGAIRSAAK